MAMFTTQHRVVVTGANGFIGSEIARRLIDLEIPALLVDQTPIDICAAHTELYSGSLIEDATLRRIQEFQPTIVLHLASMLGGAAAQQPELAYAVNVEASLSLLRVLRPTTRFVFASSIAVFGADLPPVVDDDTIAEPTMVYGQHKLLVEQAIRNNSQIEGISLRLPGIVANPGANSKLQSAFLHALFYGIRDAKPVTVPVPANGTTWLLSRTAAVDALLHAAFLTQVPTGVALNLPAQRVEIAQLVAAITSYCREHFGTSNALVSYQPDPLLTAQFATYPALATPLANQLGFTHDGSLEALVQRAWS